MLKILFISWLCKAVTIATALRIDISGPPDIYSHTLAYEHLYIRSCPRVQQNNFHIKQVDCHHCEKDLILTN